MEQTQTSKLRPGCVYLYATHAGVFSRSPRGLPRMMAAMVIVYFEFGRMVSENQTETMLLQAVSSFPETVQIIKAASSGNKQMTEFVYIESARRRFFSSHRRCVGTPPTVHSSSQL